MRLNKKIIGLGMLATTALVAPLAITISCGHENKKPVELEFNVDENRGVAMTFIPLSKQNNEHIDLLMDNGKLKDANLIVDKDLENLGSLTMDITLSNNLRQNLEFLLEDAKKKNSEDNTYNLQLNFGTNKEIETAFFAMLTDAKNAAKISKKINDLSKANKFHLEFNLILPQWLNGFNEITLYFNWNDDLDKIHNRGEETVEKVISIEKENVSTFRVKSLFLWDLGLKRIKFDKLPKELEFLYVDGNNLTTLDGIEKLVNLESLYFDHNDISTINIDKLPKSLKKIHFDEWRFSTNDLEKIKQYCKDHNIKIH